MKIAFVALSIALAVPATAQDLTTVHFPVTDLAEGDAAAIQDHLKAFPGVTASVGEEGWLTLELAPKARICFSEVQAALEAAGKPKVEEEAFVVDGVFEVVLATDDGDESFAEGAIEGTIEPYGPVSIQQVEGADVKPAAKGKTTVFRIEHTISEDAEGCSFAEIREAAAVALLTQEADGFTFGLVDVRWNGADE